MFFTNNCLNKYGLIKRLQRWQSCLLVLIFVLFSGRLYATDSLAATLTLKPQQCISIHQGQQCYADVELMWTAPNVANYCLFSSQRQKPLRCWQNQNTGEYHQEIVSNTNVQFYLRAMNHEQNLAFTELEMAWVYKKNARSKNWRMF